MPDDQQPDDAQSDSNFINGYQEIVATLIRSLIRVPGFPAKYRDRLYAFISEIKNFTKPDELSAVAMRIEGLRYRLTQGYADELSTVARRVEEFCSKVVADINTQGAFKNQEEELRRILNMLGESVASINHANESTGSSIDSHLSALNQAVIEDGEPVQFSQKIEFIANGLKKTTELLKSEIQESRKQVKGAGQKIQDLESKLAKTRAESMRDGLTGLANRRSFNEFITRELARFDADRPWCLIMLDVDHFKLVNDTHGHIIGDALLIKLSRTLREEVLAPRFLARYGGEEFVIMLPRATLAAGTEFCDSLLRKVRSARWLYRSQVKEITISATVSAGISAQHEDDTPETLIARADKALYLAKENGRNRLQTENDIA